jgi:molybdopterin converting factor small subunit
MSTDESATVERTPDATPETTVTVRCTGHIRREVGEPDMEYSFEGETLRAFLDAFFEEYDVADMLIAETEAEATAHGWVPDDVKAAGSWAKNPEGEQTRAFARVAINGQFNEHLDGLDTELDDGDRVALMYPFMFCC